MEARRKYWVPLMTYLSLLRGLVIFFWGGGGGNRLDLDEDGVSGSCRCVGHEDSMEYFMGGIFLRHRLSRVCMSSLQWFLMINGLFWSKFISYGLRSS